MMQYPFLELIEIVENTVYGNIAVHKFDINQTQSIKKDMKTLDHNEMVLLNSLYENYKQFYQGVQY